MAFNRSPYDLSLLWPPDYQRSDSVRLNAHAITDLDLDHTVAALVPSRRYTSEIRSVLLNLCDSSAVINYRQAILTEFFEHPELVSGLNKLLPEIEALDHFGYTQRSGHTPLHEIVWRVGQLESYVTCVSGLHDLLIQRTLESDGLRRLKDRITEIANSKDFQSLAAELPEMLSQVRSIASITIGVNLDEQLRPVGATLLSINKKKFRGLGSSLLGVLFNIPNEWEGIAGLHTVSNSISPSGVDLSDPMMYPLFRDLAQVVKQASRPVADALQRYTRINTQFLGTLKIELAFYLGAVELFNQLTAAGLPICRPEICPQQERTCEASETYNLNLAIRLLAKGEKQLEALVVKNDVKFDSNARIFILTGPNQGGKTTYTQAIGLIHVLAQAGLYVPGSGAKVSPVDSIFTHFPVQEAPEMEAGRLGEESRRLSEIFAQVTRYSLVLLNESLSSTSFGESLYLARDIVAVLRRLGARAIYATHLHELAEQVDTLNVEIPGDSNVASLISVVGDSHNGEVSQTFRIIPGPPMGRSYAKEVAARYGISYEQLMQALRSRGVVDSE